MTWLRVDDGFAFHPKIGKLTDKDFRVWVRVLCHCARYEDPTVDDATIGEVKDLTETRVARYAELGLLDETPEGMVIHDWILYTTASVGDKVDYYLKLHPKASANEVVRAVAGKRELVLSEVRRYHENGSQNGSLAVPEEPR